MKKRIKIVFATISIAGYSEGRKVTNTVNWKVFLIDEKDPDELIERERQKILAAVFDGAKGNSNSVDFRAKVAKREEHFFDTFLASDRSLIGSITETKRTLKQI